MRYLRHGPLLLWIIIVVVLAAVGGTAFYLGRDTPPPAAPAWVAARPADVATVDALRVQTAVVVGLPAGKARIAAAEDLAAAARAAHTDRAAVAVPGDRLAALYAQLAAEADRVADGARLDRLTATSDLLVTWSDPTRLG